MNAIVLHVELTLHPEHREAYLARALQHRDNVLQCPFEWFICIAKWPSVSAIEVIFRVEQFFW